MLRKLLNIPSVATWCAADLVPSDDPTYVGRPGSVASRGANFALQNSDFLLAIGVRLDFSITGYAPQNLAREAYKIAVDVDPAELRQVGTPPAAAGLLRRARLHERAAEPT